MKWGQIKTIFIISFLIVNIFLFQQFLDKFNRANYETIAQQTTFEENLNADEITIGELPERGRKEAYISARRYQFSVDDIEALGERVESQNIYLTEQGEMIFGEFVNPIPLDLNDQLDQSIENLKTQILFGNEYIFWDYYENENVLLFFQEQEGHTVYFNEAGLLIVILNEENEAMYYGQTLLTGITPQSEEETVIDPMNAVEVLYNSNSLFQKDHISNMRLGYHTLVPLEGGLQVFAPTWEINVNDERTYFVNAMEGQMIPYNETDFIENMKNFIEREIERLDGSEEE